MSTIDFNAGAEQVANLPNYLGYSQGTGPNRAFEALFEGIGNVVKTGMDAKDRQIRQDIQDRSRKMFDGVNQEFGLDAPKLPSGMDVDVDKINTLQRAMEQGKISETNYYGRLATLTKQMRTKFPGYEDVVDDTIASVTGTRPANAYRDALLSEVNAINAGMSESAKNDREWAEQNQEWISIVAPDFFENAGKYDLKKVRSEVARMQGEKVLIQREIDQLSLIEKTEGVNSTRAEKTISKDFSFAVDAAVNASLGANSEGFQETINNFINGGMKAAELDKFVKDLTVAENNLRTQLLAKGRKDYSSYLTQDKINKAVEDALAPIKMAKESLLGGDFKAAVRYATINKAIADETLQEMFKSDPRFVSAAGLSEINKNVSEEIINTIAADNPGTLGLEAAGRVMLGDKQVLGKVLEGGNSKVARATIDALPKSIIGHTGDKQSFKNIVDGMFGPSAPEFMLKIKPEDRKTLYMKFLDPQITASIKAKGSPEDMQKYASWALEKFSSIQEFKLAAGELGDSLAGVDIQFDDKTKRFVMVEDVGKQIDQNLFEGIVPIIGPQLVYKNAYLYKQKVKALESLNGALSVLEPVLDASGMDTNKTVQKLIHDLNVNLEDGMPDSFWGKVFGAVKRIDLEAQDVASGEFGESEIDLLNEKASKSASLKDGDQHDPTDFAAYPSDPNNDKFLVSRLVGHSSDHVEGMNPEFRTRLAKMMRSAPPEIGQYLGIYSGYRSKERQAELFNAAVKKYGSEAAARKWVAKPGHSRHQHGTAVDIAYKGQSLKHAPRHVIEWLHENASQYGLHFPLSWENWHVEMMGSRSRKG